MAFTSPERASLLAHLLYLRTQRYEQFASSPTAAEAIDAATAEQVAAARVLLTTLDRLSAGLSSLDSRLAVKEIVGELVFRDDELALREQQYMRILEQLGLLFGLYSPAGGVYGVADDDCEPERVL